jgi:sugar/nucleoside kinase (ribokinase family)
MNPPAPRSGILAAGNWIIDHVKLLDAWPAQDALANILAQTWGNGGSPYNILKDLARLGAPGPLAAIGLIGDDADGRRILEDCRAHKIDTAQLRSTPDAPTSYSDVMTDSRTGRRTFFHHRGANALLAPEHFDFTAPAAAAAKIFHLGYLLLLDKLDEPAAPDDGGTGGTAVVGSSSTGGGAGCGNGSSIGGGTGGTGTGGTGTGDDSTGGDGSSTGGGGGSDSNTGGDSGGCGNGGGGGNSGGTGEAGDFCRSAGGGGDGAAGAAGVVPAATATAAVAAAARTPRPRASEVLRRARAAGLITSVDCVSETADGDRFQTIVRPVLCDVDILFVNDFEAGRLTGIDLHSAGRLNRVDVGRAIRALLDMGVGRWVIFHAPEAVCAASPAGALHWQPSVNLPKAAIKGTAGAGDAFAAGVLHALHEDAPIADALCLGVCTAAACLASPTCSASILPLAGTLALGNKHGFLPLPS